jgi:hypothetical protein
MHVMAHAVERTQVVWSACKSTRNTAFILSVSKIRYGKKSYGVKTVGTISLFDRYVIWVL